MTKELSPAKMAVIAIILIAAMVALTLWMRPSTSPSTTPVPTDTEEIVQAEDEEEGVAPPSGVTAATPRPLALTYNKAVELYGTYRFQFLDCHGTPGTIHIASGATFMLDNRDAKAHTIMVGAQSYSVGAYGFRIASVAKKGEYQITCDGGGAATLSVE